MKQKRFVVFVIIFLLALSLLPQAQIQAAPAQTEADAVTLTSVTVVSSNPLTLKLEMLLPQRCGVVRPTYSLTSNRRNLTLNVGFSEMLVECGSNAPAPGTFFVYSEVRTFDTAQLEPGLYHLLVQSWKSDVAFDFLIALGRPAEREPKIR